MADQHPLPWRWGVGPGEDPRERPNLLDANGAPLISRASGCTVASSYVRAVTERAKAMEQLLRHIEWSASGHNAFTDALWNCCPVCDGVAPDIRGKRAPKDFERGHGADCSLGVLLAEIDAAKAGG